MTTEKKNKEVSNDDLKSMLLLLQEILITEKHPGREPSPEEKERIVTFLDQAIANLSLNAQLLTLRDEKISPWVIDLLCKLTFKSRNWEKGKGYDINSNDGLNLKQLSTLLGIASLRDDLAVFKRSDLIQDSTSLDKLYQDVQQTLELNKTFEKSSGGFLTQQLVKQAPLLPSEKFKGELSGLKPVDGDDDKKSNTPGS